MISLGKLFFGEISQAESTGSRWGLSILLAFTCKLGTMQASGQQLWLHRVLLNTMPTGV